MDHATKIIPLGHLVDCCECGIRFAFDADLHARRKTDGKSFYCPNGHQQHYGDTEAKRLQRELESQRKRTEWAAHDAKRQRERADRAERRTRAYKGHASRLRNRIVNGKCPCCSEHFDDVESHIAEKHPGYATDEA